MTAAVPWERMTPLDAADRLILDESAADRAAHADAGIVVIGDDVAALAWEAARTGGRGIRVHCDLLTAERALAAERALTAEPGSATGHDLTTFPALDAALVDGARVVLLRLPRSLDALRDLAGLIAAHADPSVVVFAGGRIKHMALAMNDVLRERFDRVDVTRARQKSRVLVARAPHDGADPVPRCAEVDGRTVCAYGGVFAGAGIDIGTRALLDALPPFPTTAPVVDLACGSGVVGAALALRQPELLVHAYDVSAAAVASARATAESNGLADRMTVFRDDILSSAPGNSAEVVVLNPPFHTGGAVTPDLAPRFFRDAARVLRPGGELWTVWNSALGYRPALTRLVGPTRQVSRTPKFTVTVSVRRS